MAEQHAVGAYEAKVHLARLLDRVARGERIIITRHGVPVARLEPVHESPRRPVAEIAQALREFRRGKTLGGSVRDAIEEGRR